MIRYPYIYRFLDERSVLRWGIPKFKDPERLQFIRNYVARAAAPEAAAGSELVDAAAAAAPQACGGAGCGTPAAAAASPRRGGSRHTKRRTKRSKTRRHKRR